MFGNNISSVNIYNIQAHNNNGEGSSTAITTTKTAATEAIDVSSQLRLAEVIG